MTENTLKTGTTTVGLRCKDCVVMAADMRATAGYLIANKNIEKVFALTDNIAITIAGSVSAIQVITKYLRSEIKLRMLRSGREFLVKEVASLLRNWVYSMIRHSGGMDVSHFLIGGSDREGVWLYDLFPDGSLTLLEDYATSGSGSSYVYGVLESNYKPDLSEQDGVDLAIKSIDAALQRDIASGNGLNVYVVDKNGARKVATKRVNTHVQ
ncbi:MAG: proteasome subunit beta [Candidatus Woesearchaeota archaeon]